MPGQPAAANRTAASNLNGLARQARTLRDGASGALFALKEFPDRMEEMDKEVSAAGPALVRPLEAIRDEARKPEGRPFAVLRGEMDALVARKNDLKGRRDRIRSDFEAAESRFRNAVREFGGIKRQADQIRKGNIRDHVVLKAYEKGGFDENDGELKAWEAGSVAQCRRRFDKHSQSCEDVFRKVEELRREIVQAFGGADVALSETSEVSFVSEKEPPLRSKIVVAGEPVGDPGISAPAKKFHRFVGWRRSGTGPVLGPDAAAALRTPRTGAPVEFRAAFEEVPARVELRVSDDIDPYAVLDYIRSRGEPVPAQKPPEAPWGKVFAGWTVGGRPYGFDRPLEDDVIRIVASWEDARFPVRFLGAEGMSGEKDRELSLRLADGLPGDVRPARALDHYDFLGWSRRQDASAPDLPAGGEKSGKTLRQLITEGALELVLHPVWSPTQYDVRFLSRTAGSAEPVECGVAKASVEEPVAKPSDPEAIPGRRFDGWFVDGASSGYDFAAPVKGNLRLVARWATVTNEATFLRRDGKTVLARTKGSADDPVDPPPAESVEGDGWRFLRWSVSKDGPAWDGAGKPLLADVRLFPVCEYLEIPVIVDRSAEYAVETNFVPYGRAFVRPRDPESISGSSAFAGWTRKGDDSAEPYDFSRPVREPLVLGAVWRATLVPEPDDGRPAPTYRPAKSVPVPATAVDAVRWLDGRGVSPLLARIAAGVLLFFLVLEAAVIVRGR